MVVLDLVLPGMQGEQVLKKMHDKKMSRKIPVLILTVKSEEANVNNCLKLLGAVGYLIKADHTLEEIVEKIKVGYYFNYLFFVR